MKIEYRFVTAGVAFMASAVMLCLAVGPAKAAPPVVVSPVRVAPVYVPVRTPTPVSIPKPVTVRPMTSSASNYSKTGQALVPSYSSNLPILASMYYGVALSGEVQDEFSSYEDCADNSDTETTCIKGNLILLKE